MPFQQGGVLGLPLPKEAAARDMQVPRDASPVTQGHLWAPGRHGAGPSGRSCQAVHFFCPHAHPLAQGPAVTPRAWHRVAAEFQLLRALTDTPSVPSDSWLPPALISRGRCLLWSFCASFYARLGLGTLQCLCLILSLLWISEGKQDKTREDPG